MRDNNKDNLQRHYSFFDKVKLAYYLVRTKLLDKRIRLIRFPFILRGKNFIDFGSNLTTGYWCRFEVFPNDNDKQKRLILGDNIQMNDFVHICAIKHVEIGDGCLFASHIYISDNSHGSYRGEEEDSSPAIRPDHRSYVTSPVIIGKNVWVGEGVIVLPGVTIGDGAIIGAHSVVSRDVPPACIAVGSPARVVKRYSFEKSVWEKV